MKYLRSRTRIDLALALLALLQLAISCAGQTQAEKPVPVPAENPAVQAAPPPPPPPQESPAPAADAQAQDFGEEARLLYRVAACTGEGALPPGLDPAEVELHCKELLPRVVACNKYYREKIKPFFDSIVPADVPARVIYPFGGGDLLAALNTYRGADEITTLSLELAGDPRRLRGLDATRMRESLELFRTRVLSGLLYQNNSTSEALQNLQRGDLPGQLSYFITALAVHGLEPVGLRFFSIQADGSVHYLTPAEIQGSEALSAQKRKSNWVSPDFSEAFANSELTFRRARDDGSSVLVTHRHIAANLADESLRRNPGILKYLEKQGRIAAMTKAASYLLWNKAFIRIRQYLLDSMDYMVSDSTGIPPEFAKAAGFVQETYGSFQGSFLEASPAYNDQFRELWSSQPHRKMPFRYGYPDSARSLHLVITRKGQVPQSPAGDSPNGRIKASQ